jgi:UDP-N-acetylmuramate: L-alanyl-gamma-D-glutamyl-meso-diaminopimelate ligase
LKVHFIGIAGTGMGALAGLLRMAGHEVRGSDTEVYPPMSTQLEAAGIPVMRGFSAAHLDWGPDRVVVGNVCGAEHVEVVAARARGIALASFPSMLAEALLTERRSLVVAGTHGKTTTASLLAHLLASCGQDPSYLVGGVPLNLGRGFHLGGGPAFVVEGDEYDTAFFDKKSKFLHYRPQRAILTSVEFDHADIFAGIEEVRAAFREFVQKIPSDGDLVVHLDDSEAMGVAAAARCTVLTYRVLSGRDHDRSSADYTLEPREQGGLRRSVCEIFERGQSIGEFSTQLLGRYNLGNLLAAVAIARREGAPVEALRAAVRRFRGVKRRQELVGIAHGVRVVDDFAHHPTAVTLTLAALRKRFPDHALHVCFEPRSASSRRRVFLEPYAAAFDTASAAYIGPLFRPEKVPGDDRLEPEDLAVALRARGIWAQAYNDHAALREAVTSRVVPGDTVVCLSSGSFDGLPHKLLRELGDPVVYADERDRPGVDALLAVYGLPPITRGDAVDTLVVRGGDDDRPVACVSLESAGASGFLFGLAVEPDRRGEGLGWVLGDCVLRHARTLGVERVYLTTTTAADFFAAKLGFDAISANEVDPEIRSTANFTAAAGPDDAVCMVLRVPPDGPPAAGPGRATEAGA